MANMQIQKSVDGLNPYTLVKQGSGTFPVLLEDRTGNIWSFFCLFDSGDTRWDLKYVKSTNSGASWGSTLTAVSGILQGQLGVEELGTGRIILTYWKNVAGTATPYYIYTDDQGDTWTGETIIAVS